MNDTRIVRLLEIVNQEIRLFHRLLEVLQQEQQALIDDDLIGIEESVAAKQEVALAAKELEFQRLECVERLYGELDVGPGQRTLSRLIEALEHEPGVELAQMRQTLLDLNAKIRDANANSAFLIRQSRRYTDRCLNILTGETASRGKYGKFGRVRPGAARSVINRTA